MQKLRVVCLYRVSTRKQARGPDIPMQKQACHEFVVENGWEIVDEIIEIDVSGYNLPIHKRPKITKLKESASRKEFDILLVFMVDRIVRSESDGPALVMFMCNCGVRVWSVKEGELLNETRTDRLMNFVRFWQAQGESENTSLRVTESHLQMTQQGLWRGGTPPYGYMLVHTGRTNKKGVGVADIAIDPATSIIVAQIFMKAVYEGMGTHRLAAFLNEQYPNSNQPWWPQAVGRIIKNAIYTGRLRFGKFKTEAIEVLRIVDDEIFARANEAMTARDTDNPDKTVPLQVRGEHLLNHILICEHCGSRLVGTMTTKGRAIYRCYGKAARGCTGQAIYSARLIEGAVLAEICPVINNLKGPPEDSLIIDSLKEETVNARRLMDNARLQLCNIQRSEKRITNEILKSLHDESAYSREQLSIMLDSIQAQTVAKRDEFKVYRDRWATTVDKMGNSMTEIPPFYGWKNVFERSSCESKKMILQGLIERITINRKYEVKIFMKITKTQYEQLIR